MGALDSLVAKYGEISEATRSSYLRNERYWIAWRLVRGLGSPKMPIPLEEIERFVADEILDEPEPRGVRKRMVDRGYRADDKPPKYATLYQRLAWMGHRHREEGLPSPMKKPEVGVWLKTAKRHLAELGKVATKPPPLTQDLLNHVLRCNPVESSLDARNRAMLLFAWFSGGRRPCEMPALRIEQMRTNNRGWDIWIPYSKTDQGAKGAYVPCYDQAATAMRVWLDCVGEKEGPIFRCSKDGKLTSKSIRVRTVRGIIKRMFAKAGLGHLPAYGIRHGYIFEARKAGVEPPDIMAMTLHRSLAGLAAYFQVAELQQNPGSKIGKTGRGRPLAS